MGTSRPAKRHAFDPVVAPLGALAVVATAAVLTPLRDSWFGNTNLALLLVVEVAAVASVGGRRAGVVAALLAGLSFNFFLTRPYLSLHIADSRDVATVVLLIVVGLVVGEFARARGRRVVELRDRTASAHRLERIARALVSGLGNEELAVAIGEEVRVELDLEAVRWEPLGTGTGLPVMEHSGWVPGPFHRHQPGGFELPAEGCELPVAFQGARLGALVLVPKPGVGVSSEQRRVAVALADLLGSALARGSAAWAAGSSPAPHPEL